MMEADLEAGFEKPERWFEVTLTRLSVATPRFLTSGKEVPVANAGDPQ